LLCCLAARIRALCAVTVISIAAPNSTRFDPGSNRFTHGSEPTRLEAVCIVALSLSYFVD
jgi:hypothetical protein